MVRNIVVAYQSNFLLENRIEHIPSKRVGKFNCTQFVLRSLFKSGDKEQADVAKAVILKQYNSMGFMRYETLAHPNLTIFH